MSPSNAIRYATIPEMTGLGQSELDFSAKEALTRCRHGCATQNLSGATGERAANVFTRCEDINFA